MTVLPVLTVPTVLLKGEVGLMRFFMLLFYFERNQKAKRSERSLDISNRTRRSC